MTYISRLLFRIVPLFFLLLFADISIAQKADFTADNSSGCSPLTVKFTNKSTGVSPSATYKWDLGVNGNTSTLKDAGATYKTEQTYTIKLTVTDNGKSDSKEMTITVYKKPVVSFKADVIKGCSPLVVNFTSTSSAGDGTISNYFWDFGDGATDKGDSYSQIQHTYSVAQTALPALTVVNSNGCIASSDPSSVKINVLPAIIASFTPVTTTLCKESDALAVSNTSTGPGTLSYEWDFGDSKTDVAKTPSHVFGKKGVYNISLKVKSSEGCTPAVAAPVTINVANFTTDFEVPAQLCTNNNLSFNDLSMPSENNTQWLLDGSQAGFYSPFTATFSTGGTHTLSLSKKYGTCTDTKTKSFVVKEGPVPTPFTLDNNKICEVPVTLNFKDNTKGAVKWEWDFDNYYYGFNPTAFTQSSSFTFSSEKTYNVALKITNADGCSNTVYQSIVVTKPQVSISPSIYPANTCEKTDVQFYSQTNTPVKEYLWDFGDGEKSVAATPSHSFAKAGSYTVTLSYVTENGCTGSASYPVTVYAKPVFDFSVLSQTVCGSEPILFNITGIDMSTVSYITADYGNGYGEVNVNNSTPGVQYSDAGTHTVTLTLVNPGCRSSLTKPGYIKVLPPFPRVEQAINTCDGDRSTVTFTESSVGALSWSWDFGDGTAPYSYTSKQAEIKHAYAKSGTYKAALTTTNGTCTMTDTTIVYVLKKQKPTLTLDRSSFCANDTVSINVDGLEDNPHAVNANNYNEYAFQKIEYSDGTMFSGAVSYKDYYSYFPIRLLASRFDSDKSGFRVITSSYYFGCEDTTDFAAVKISGPTAGFSVAQNNVCFKNEVQFNDLSKIKNNITISKWEWTFGDGEQITTFKAGAVKHKYNNPGYYSPYLKITDKNGCTSEGYLNESVNVVGPKANFSISQNPVSPDTYVYFNNYSLGDYYNANYTWHYGDGTSSNDYNGYHTYSKPGADTVVLIASNALYNCADTAKSVVFVKNINLSFTYTTTNINNSGCPPVLASFSNTSANTPKVSWDFGDGSTADNLNFASHTYQKPGKYKVTIYGYYDYGLVDSSFDYITINGPYATLSADKLYGCRAEEITLSAQAENTTQFTWDFGDGTLQDAQETSAKHKYLSPGVYTPALIVKNNEGCSFSYFLDQKIVIDTLHIAIETKPPVICVNGIASFQPEIYSIAKNEMQQELQYSWQFGTQSAADNSTLESPYFQYNDVGDYIVTVKAVSPFGCEAENTKIVSVKSRVHGTIAGPSDLCKGEYGTFTSDIPGMDKVTWEWDFDNSSHSALQNPDKQLFNEPRAYNVLLVVNNEGCLDTTSALLDVHANPVVNLLPAQPAICLGGSIQLNAHDGIIYNWHAAAGLTDVLNASPVVTPTTNTQYTVDVTNNFGCTSTDSITVKVVQPFKITTMPEVHVCNGDSIQLHVTGANNYTWTGTGLSSFTSADPIVKTDQSGVYTVTGHDEMNCLEDKADVQLKVEPLPTVTTIPDLSLVAGSSVVLQTSTSNDVVKWQWQPSQYLSCNNCSAPAASPNLASSYVVTVSTQYGCSAKDTVNIKVICNEGLVLFPTSFTPNNDNLNDRFNVRGKGIKLIKHLVIYERWGTVVFERNNFTLDDKFGGWDGTRNNLPLPTGTYVYAAEIVCATGEIFTYRGTVVLIR
ncbi:PKD domain-containing protein [Danxiaibacter flavus]|uniref:PKD domain-containing protein n=1 Tax=Danxiaibacter flavus TaxID=3049108 RepID=A0ABV3ZFL6_9BACT|nr:PKD domain-containing protein [Chitinophagaceae bacterium DXS]